MELETLDCRGLRCPLPIIKSAEYLKDKPIGFTFILLSDDPATAPDLIAWSRMSGNLATQLGADTFQIKKS